jgi:hypothetical protein
VASAGAPPDAIGFIDVTTATVDDLIGAGRVRPPTLVKIDVEGAEFGVLDGMEATLRTHRPVVLCEIDGEESRALAAKRSRILDLLRSAGYTIEDLPPSYPGSAWLVEHILARPAERVTR